MGTQAKLKPTGEKVVFGALAELALIRPLFQSEADFQHALAWKLREIDPALEIRLERPATIDGKRMHLDLLTHGSRRLAFELKYWTAKLEHEHGGEHYSLLEAGGHDFCGYDFVKDVRRLELAVADGLAEEGFAVAVTNDRAHWKNAGSGTFGEAFRLPDGRVLEGTMAWAEGTGSGTSIGRTNPIQLAGRHRVDWRGYSQISDKRGGEFRALVVRVPWREETL